MVYAVVGGARSEKCVIAGRGVGLLRREVIRVVEEGGRAE
jgi:hypothetical protein